MLAVPSNARAPGTRPARFDLIFFFAHWAPGCRVCVPMTSSCTSTLGYPVSKSLSNRPQTHTTSPAHPMLRPVLWLNKFLWRCCLVCVSRIVTRNLLAPRWSCRGGLRPLGAFCDAAAGTINHGMSPFGPRYLLCYVTTLRPLA
uniref:Uncharacterized protein n=1 Tax=Vibrio splendidus TaxID=29497 RepID=A0A0H3ZYA7_VIBSP|nr:hypothetical protein [Vibrio splendidus]